MNRTAPEMTSDIEVERGAFGTALSGMRPHLYRRALALTRDHAWTDDLVQATIERALSARTKFRAGTNLSAWLGSILYNIFVDACRKRRAFVSIDLWNVAAPAADSELRPWDLLDKSDLWEAVSLLPRKLRVISELVYTHGLSHRDVARQLGLTVGTVATRLFRARAKLRVLLQGRFEQRQQRLPPTSGRRFSEPVRKPAPPTPAVPELAWPATKTSPRTDWTRPPPSVPGP